MATVAQSMTRTLSISNLQPSLWKQGSLVKREKGIIRTQWKERFVILFEGSIFYYALQTDLTPRGVFHLFDGKVVELPEKKYKKKFSFSVRSAKGEELVFVAPDEVEMKNWISSIVENLSKVPAPPPSKEFKKSRGKSPAVYVTGKIADTILNMGAGGKLVREFLSDESVIIMDSIKNFLVQKLGSDKANEIEKQAISLGIKVALLYKDKKLKNEDLRSARFSIRLLVSKAIDGYEIPFTFSSSETVESIINVQKSFEAIIRPVLTEKSIAKFNSLFATLTNEDLIEDLFEKKKWKECEIIATTLRELWDNGQF